MKSSLGAFYFKRSGNFVVAIRGVNIAMGLLSLFTAPSTPIRATLYPPTRGSAADSALTLLRLQAAEQSARERLSEQRIRLAVRLRKAKRRLHGTAHSSLRRIQALQQECFLRDSQTALQHTVDALHRDSLELALRIAQRIIGDAYITQTSALAQRITRALTTLPTMNEHRVSVNPSQHAGLEKDLPNLQLRQDPRVTAGTATVQSSGGEIEVDWSMEFERLSQSLRRDLEHTLLGVSRP